MFKSIEPSAKMDHAQLKLVRYFAYYDAQTFLGVTKKISQTVAALNQLGYQAESFVVSERGIFPHFKMFISVLRVKTDVLILRSTVYSMTLLAFALAWQRLKGTRIVIDVPTPNAVIMYEIRMMRDKGWIGKQIRLTAMVIAFPWSLWFAHKIIQYAHESEYFSFGVQSKTKLMANGIAVDEIPRRQTVPAWPATEFVMIGVGSLAPWHGYDRVIRGIAIYLLQNPGSHITPKLIVVGDGFVRHEWEVLAHNLGVSSCVEFVGYRRGAELDVMFDRAHVAIGSLGLFRIGLEIASVLKSREYAARGIPFVLAGYDLDFDPTPWFVARVENTNEPIHIKELLEWYGNLQQKVKCNENIRQYASKHLDYKTKVKSLVLE